MIVCSIDSNLNRGDVAIGQFHLVRPASHTVQVGQVKLWQVSLWGESQVDLPEESALQLGSRRNGVEITPDPHHSLGGAEGIFHWQPEYILLRQHSKYFDFLPLKQNPPSISMSDAQREGIVVEERFHPDRYYLLNILTSLGLILPPPDNTVKHTEPDQ